MYRRMIYRPRRRRRNGKSLQKNKRSSPEIHPSNPSIHPNRLPLLHRSCLFRKRPRSRRSASRSRLAAANRPHLSSHHRRNLCQWSSPPPFVKSRSQASYREKNLGAAFLFGQSIRNKSARQRCSQKHLHQKPLQRGHGNQLHRTHSEKYSKRATTAQPEQPLQPRKS